MRLQRSQKYHHRVGQQWISVTNNNNKGRRSYSTGFPRRSTITMMPEGPEVRTLVDQLQGGVGRKFMGLNFVSGRYHETRNGQPDNYQQFRNSLTSTSTMSNNTTATTTTIFPDVEIDESKTDLIQSWNCKGKFMYIILDNGLSAVDNHEHDPDYQRSIWITLGMTGKFLNEQAHQQLIEQQENGGNRCRNTESQQLARWYIELMDVTSHNITRIYYHDVRNFGRIKFCLSKQMLIDKLQSLGPDILAIEENEHDNGDDSKSMKMKEQDFVNILKAQRPSRNICKLLMDQSKISGIGNYLLSESLYRANIDPFACVEEIDENRARDLFREIQATAVESYRSQGMTREKGGQYRTPDGNRGNFVYQLQCYGRSICMQQGNPVIKETNGPHGRTIWYTDAQLFMSRQERRQKQQQSTATTTSRKRMTTRSTSTTAPSSASTPAAAPATRKPSIPDDDNAELFPTATSKLLSGLTDPSWKEQLEGAFNTESFHKLAQFLEKERSNGAVIYPPESEIFNALNLCPFDKVRVVIVGQDPYHGAGQGHGLAFSVKRGFKPLPPSLRNIFREVMDDVGIDQPNHGCLESWAVNGGVLLLNTVLTVRHGEPNSHANNYGWEAFSDKIIEVLNNERENLVFLLWGNPAAQKAKGVDPNKHTIIRTSHPSPLSATRTSSPFLGSRCFSRVNRALVESGQDPVDWNVDSGSQVDSRTTSNMSAGTSTNQGETDYNNDDGPRKQARLNSSNALPLKILSWNIAECKPSHEAPAGFDNEAAVLNEILAQEADVLCLQECPSAEWRPAALSGQYKCWGVERSHCGYVQVWARTALHGQAIEDVPGPSVAVMLKVGKTPMAISSSHLVPYKENAPVRKLQVKELTLLLRQHAPLGILAGDFNMRQAEDKDVETDNGLRDAWKVTTMAWQQYTWNSLYNKYHAPENALLFKCRFDRIYYYDDDSQNECNLGLMEPALDAFALFANQKRSADVKDIKQTFCLSDHFGMVCSFSVSQPTQEEEKDDDGEE